MSHAVLSASGASRWMACAPSARLEETLPEKKSEYADEGTRAHKLGEALLLHSLAGEPMPDQADYEADMWRYMIDYRDFVMEQYAEALAETPDAIIELEYQVDTSKYIPEGFGTIDCSMICEDRLTLIDYKHGMGVPVFAEGNPQLKVYALGALDRLGLLYDVKEVRVVIFQPRIDNTTEAIYTVDELRAWGDNELIPAAAKAWAGEGAFVPGKHCQFCRAKATCRALAEYNLDLMRHAFAGPALLEESEIPEILRQSELLVMWAGAVKDYALDMAEKGKEWPGYKLVEGRSNRKFTDEEAVALRLKQKGYKEFEIFNTKLKGLGDLEKLVGKKPFAAELSDLIVKPKGAPTLVPEGDKRVSITEAMFD